MQQHTFESAEDSGQGPQTPPEGNPDAEGRCSIGKSRGRPGESYRGERQRYTEPLLNSPNTCHQEFEIADHHLRETLPPIIQATFSLVPPLLAPHIVIQNRLLGLYYTVLHGYCEENDFPSPAPPMDDVIAAWAQAFEPGKRNVESISIIARGRGIREPLNLSNDGAPLGRQLSAPPPEAGMRRASSGLTTRGSTGAG